MALVTACGKCQAPIRKAFSKIAYERGVVLITCGGCGVRHLVADHLGWMADHSTRAGAAPSHVDLSTMYGERLKRGSLEPSMRQDGQIGVALDGDLKDLVEGLTDEELQQLYQRATHKKD